MEFIVSGITCDGCARSVTKAVRRVEPDASVTVDLEGGRVTIVGQLSEEQASRAIQEAGFEVAA